MATTTCVGDTCFLMGDNFIREPSIAAVLKSVTDSDTSVLMRLLSTAGIIKNKCPASITGVIKYVTCAFFSPAMDRCCQRPSVLSTRQCLQRLPSMQVTLTHRAAVGTVQSMRSLVELLVNATHMIEAGDRAETVMLSIGNSK